MTECSAFTTPADFPYLYMSEQFKDDFQYDFLKPNWQAVESPAAVGT